MSNDEFRIMKWCKGGSKIEVGSKKKRGNLPCQIIRLVLRTSHFVLILFFSLSKKESF